MTVNLAGLRVPPIRGYRFRLPMQSCREQGCSGGVVVQQALNWDLVMSPQDDDHPFALVVGDPSTPQFQDVGCVQVCIARQCMLALTTIKQVWVGGDASKCVKIDSSV